MNRDEKAISRILFKLKIHEANGNRFEDIFVAIMNYLDPAFQAIKPWGNIGDRKNDGYIHDKGVFYQVYAPEEIQNSYPDVIRKLENDLEGLLKQWTDVKEFYFVLNDKYRGINADAAQILKNLIKKHNLVDGGFITSKDLERMLFSLEFDQIVNIIGHIPNPNVLASLNFSIVGEVVNFIMRLPIQSRITNIEFPDWDEKINFNKLSPYTKQFLDIAAQKLGSLNEFLANESFLADDLQQKLTGLYTVLKQKDWDTAEQYSGDYIFWELVKICSPKNESMYESAIITIIAKYFESCDVFEKNQ